MPEAPVDKRRKVCSCKHDVGGARQLAHGHAETQASRVERSPEGQRGLRVATRHPRQLSTYCLVEGCWPETARQAIVIAGPPARKPLAPSPPPTAAPQSTPVRLAFLTLRRGCEILVVMVLMQKDAD